MLKWIEAVKKNAKAPMWKNMMTDGDVREGDTINSDIEEGDVVKCRSASSSNEHDLNPSIPWHVIFVFLVPILIGVMQIEYQNKKESPFEAHPLQKHIFLTAICIYGALLGIKIHTKTSNGYLQKILSYGLLLSGVFSSVSLLSILLQKQFLWTVLIIWGSIPIILARRTLKISACWIIEMVAKFTWGVCKDSSASGSIDICPRV